METVTLRPKKKPGRRPLGFSEQIHIQVTPELKAWVMAQPGDAAAFVRRLLEAEYARQQATRRVE